MKVPRVEEKIPAYPSASSSTFCPREALKTARTEPRGVLLINGWQSVLGADANMEGVHSLLFIHWCIAFCLTISTAFRGVSVTDALPSTAECPILERGDNMYKQLDQPGQSVGKYIVFLGNASSADDCAEACQKNSSQADPCRSWTYFFPNYTGRTSLDVEGQPSPFASQCYGRHDQFWNPQFAGIRGFLTSGVNCDHPPSSLVPSPGPPSVHFSWDTVPVFFHSSNYTGPYDDEAIRIMARFPLVTIEKFQGPDSGYKYPLNPYKCCEEDRIVKTLKRVKAINPNVSGVFYYNSVLDFPQYRLHEEFSKNESWWLRDSHGNVIRIKVSLSALQSPNI